MKLLEGTPGELTHDEERFTLLDVTASCGKSYNQGLKLRFQES